MLAPGGCLKGFEYFSENVDKQNGEKKQSEEACDVPIMHSSSSPEEDQEECEEFDKMKKQVNRYFMELNPTIKCIRCKEFGHMARECPNER